MKSKRYLFAMTAFFAATLTVAAVVPMDAVAQESAVQEQSVAVSSVLPADPDVVPQVTTEDFVMGAVAKVSQLVGEVSTKQGWAKAVAIALVALQLFYRLLGTPIFLGVWNRWQPNTRFLVVAVTSFATYLLTQMNMGMSFAGAALSSVALIGIVDYIHKYYERFIEKKKAA